jgi:uncharacterized protein
MQTAPKLDRLVSIDALRGVAVLGILMMNVQAFAMIAQAYDNPIAHMDMTGANATVWAIANTFFSVKFITIFSALFGAGIMLMVGEGEKTGKHQTRMTWLLVIGLIHAHVFWWGDILVSYALFGMLAVRARNWSVRKLLIWAAVMITVVGLLLTGLFASFTMIPDGIDPIKLGMALAPEDLETLVATYQAGFIEHIGPNSSQALGGEIAGILLFGGRVLGMMFVGMALFKTGFLSASWKSGHYLIIAVIALAVGLGLSAWSTHIALETNFDLAQKWSTFAANYVGSLFAAFGYAALVMLICKAKVFGFIVNIFAATGRMAFTNYLTQTLIMTFIFVGAPGLGLFGTLERVEQAQLVMAVWVLQLIWSPLWLSQFRFGPFEWLWRSLTYGKLQPMAKPTSTTG